MKAIVVRDHAAGTAGMKLRGRPEPQAAINDVVVQVHASGFTWDELTWPSTWTDRLGRDRTPVIPGQELAGDAQHHHRVDLRERWPSRLVAAAAADSLMAAFAKSWRRGNRPRTH